MREAPERGQEGAVFLNMTRTQGFLQTVQAADKERIVLVYRPARPQRDGIVASGNASGDLICDSTPCLVK